MCGIAGYFGQGNEALIKTMMKHIKHRGPDSEGLWLRSDNSVGFGHTRLSIQDLTEAGAQPMQTANADITLCYNGELYGHKDQRIALEKSGIQFKGNSDTEVLLAMYQLSGIKMLNELNGMFAFAAWNESEQSLVLVRDAMGIKPLYYSWVDGTLLFSSEIKPILAARQESVVPCPIAMEAFLKFLYVPGYRTLFEGIYKLEPGTFLRAQTHEKHEIVRWYRPSHTPVEKRDKKELVQDVRTTLSEAVGRQLVSDVPVGAFLSGGIDSSSLVALASQQTSNNNLQCFAATYPENDIKREGGFGDLPYAKEVAKHFSLPLHITEVTPDCLYDMPTMVETLEEPDADLTALVTSLLCESAAQNGSTVLLSGTGGDEVFQGYRTHLAYQQLGYIPNALRGLASKSLTAVSQIASNVLSARSNIARRASRFARALPLQGADRHLAIVNSTEGLPKGLSALCEQGFYETLPNSTYLLDTFKSQALVAPNASEGQLHSWLLTQSFLSDHNFLYTDRCSMAKSLEVRVPFMDKELMDLCHRIPSHVHLKKGETKHLLKSAMEDLLPKNVIHRPKMGFNPPVRTWIAEERNELARELLDESTLRNRGIFNTHAVNTLKEQTKTGQIDGAQMMFALLYLELWFQRFVDNPQW